MSNRTNIIFKQFLATLMVVAALASASAQRVLDVSSGTFSSQAEDPTVERTIEPTDNGYKVKYSFDKAVLIPDNLFPGCEIWQLNGFTNNITPEEPAYPYACDSFTVPSGYTAQINISGEEWMTVSSKPSPARQPLLLSDTIGYTADNVSPIHYSSDDWFPSKSVSENGIHTYKGIGILNISITPVQFNIARGEARICKTLEYEVTFTPEISLLSANKPNEYKMAYFDDPYLSASTYNWDWEKSKYSVGTSADLPFTPEISENPGFSIGTTVSVPNYLIITTPLYRSAVEMFADWKKTLGFNVITQYKDKWTEDEILDAIYDQDELSYLLFVGNNMQVPGMRIKYSPQGNDRIALTDIGYACLNIDNIIPEFSYGRIPVNTSEEAMLVLYRIVLHEKNPSNTSSFYKKNLFLTSFLGDKTTESMRNTQTAYEISEYIKSQGRRVCNMFKAHPFQTPLYWTDYGKDEEGNIVYPGPIPFEMQKPQYSWEASPEDIVSEINKGYSQIFYFSHGNVKEWEDLSINADDISNFYYGKKLPVVFSMACHTGNYSVGGSLCEKFLTSKTGGALGLFGFTHGTFTMYTDILAYSLHNSMYPEPGLSPLINNKRDSLTLVLGLNREKTTELGLMHRIAITNMVNSVPLNKSSQEFKQYQAGIFTLFGDPSMNILLSKPEEVKPTILSSITGQYRISGDDDSIITLYDDNTGQIRNYKKSVSFTPPTDASQFTVCVHSVGKIPYIMDFSDKTAIAKVGSKSLREKEIVREDRTWRYYACVNENMTPDSDIYLELSFSGTTEIDGNEYLNCYAWKMGEDFSEENAALIGYMREDDDGRVYVRYIPDVHKKALEKGIDIIPYAPMMSIQNHDLKALSTIDILLYDPNLEKGDVLNTSTSNEMYNNKFWVEDLHEIECLGVTRKFWGLYAGIGSYGFYEGVGAEYGLLPYPGPRPESYCVDVWHLEEVLDGDGNRIFAPFEITNGVDEIANEENVVEETIYDIGGIEVKEPKKSGVYVRKQLLDNGKIRTEKIIVR